MSKTVEIEQPFIGFSKGLQNPVNNSIGSTVWRNGGQSTPNPGADFTFNSLMTVGESGSLRGWRAGSYGALASASWEEFNWNRIYITSSSFTLTAKFGGDLQFKTYTSLWFKFGITDFFEASYVNGSYILTDEPVLSPVWTFLNAKVGQQTDMIVEARS